MFGWLFSKGRKNSSGVELDDDAVLASLRTTQTLVYNSVVSFGFLPAELTDEQIRAVEAYAVGAHSILLSVACDLDAGKELPEDVGRRMQLLLARTLMSSIKIGLLYYLSPDEHLREMNGERLVDRLAIASRPEGDDEAFMLGVQQARTLILSFNGTGDEPDYTALKKLIDDRQKRYVIFQE